mmetsp:Transcript_11728/g.33109  ORF Transcript_11728/g.33109 Transcript_11728/m.33109 type:complete len:246 (-) Transcript_11728:1134-1871(-)
MVDIDCRASARYWSIGAPPASHCRTIVNAGLNVLKYRDTPRFGANKAFDSGSFHVPSTLHPFLPYPPTHLPTYPMLASPDTTLSQAYSDDHVGESASYRSRLSIKLDVVTAVAAVAAVDSTATASVGSGRESQPSVSQMEYSSSPCSIAVRTHQDDEDHDDDDEQTSETSGVGLGRPAVSPPVAIPAVGRGKGRRMRFRFTSESPARSPAKSPTKSLATKKWQSPTALRGSPMDRLAKKLGIKVR